AEDPHVELDRLRAAVSSMQSAIDALLAESDVARGGEHRDILETYRMFAADRGWIQRIREAVRSGLTAEAAVQKVQDDTRHRMSQASDPYIRERLMDLEDLTNRLLQHLAGKPISASLSELPDEFVLVARSLGPAELLDYDRRRLRGVALEEGSATAHVAIVARALDIPMVGRLRGALHRIEMGDLVVVNGDEAQVLVRPGEDILQAVDQAIKVRLGERAGYAALRALPAATRDGVQIDLHLNAGLTLDLPYLDETGAAGIGLFRTELPFMIRNAFPGVKAQVELYARVLEQARERPVVFRTLDIGGDKLLPYLPETEEENPAMGWRALRISLDRPAMLRQQVRALLRASSGLPLRVMFPMVAEVAEFDAARAILETELQRERKRGGGVPSAVKVGVMLEVPALLFQLPMLLSRVDFVSIGTNDLAQFLFASDRGNPRLTDRYDTLAPGFLSAIAEVVRGAHERGVPLSVCGEMAGSPLDAMALVGLGLRTLSMNSGGIGPVKAMIRSLALAPLEEFLSHHLGAGDHSLRAKLRAFARDHGVAV
ncbi:MAG TPA: phosphoenolpyruvate--protein phosphotransferase, partial [Stellaceae bacterium]|nr:phosphoenolpyruvate--protein phosphotransferase [Stellaceae bacterium]